MSDASKPRERRITPNRFLIVLLAAVLLVVLGSRYEWFSLVRGSGYNVLLAMAIVCVGVFIALVRFLVSLRSGRRVQYGLVSLLLLAVIVAIPCYWFPIRAQQAKRQAEAVKAIQEAGGNVSHWSVRGPFSKPLVKLVGPDFMSHVYSVHFDDRQAGDVGIVHIKGLSRLRDLNLSGTQVTDAGLVSLKGLKNLENLHLDHTKITDAGLVHLKELTKLKHLYLTRTSVTGSGVSELREVLPKCKIQGSFASTSR